MVIKQFKNSNYKSVIHNYLTVNNYPFENGIKVGFNCGFSGQNNNHKKRSNNDVKQIKLQLEINQKIIERFNCKLDEIKQLINI